MVRRGAAWSPSWRRTVKTWGSHAFVVLPKTPLEIIDDETRRILEEIREEEQAAAIEKAIRHV